MRVKRPLNTISKIGNDVTKNDVKIVLYNKENDNIPSDGKYNDFRLY